MLNSVKFYLDCFFQTLFLNPLPVIIHSQSRRLGNVNHPFAVDAVQFVGVAIEVNRQLPGIRADRMDEIDLIVVASGEGCHQLAHRRAA